MQKLLCIPITETSAGSFWSAILEASELADIVELRLDYLDPGEETKILKRIGTESIPAPLILTYRPREQGGMRDLPLTQRLNFWAGLSEKVRAKVAFADFELDLVESIADRTPPIEWKKVICSHHNFSETPGDIRVAFERILQTPAGVAKIATTANDITDCVPLFDLMAVTEKPVIVLGMGMPGVATRVLALSRGAMLTFGSLRRGAESASGQPTAQDLRELYRVHDLDRETEIYGVVGNPIGHSRSPLIHNSAYLARRRNAVYLPFDVKDVAGFIRDMVSPKSRKLVWNLRGLSVTIPHKIAVMPLLDWMDDSARAVGAVNTVAVNGDQLEGFNTDVAGAMKPLEAMIDLRQTRVAVIGAGGAARAICYGLMTRDAKTTVYARDAERASRLAGEFGAAVKPLREFNGDAEVVINCTPVGMQGHDENLSPIPATSLKGVSLVFDLIYAPHPTRLMMDAENAGCHVLGGMEMLIGQAAEQYRLWTGEDAPIDVMSAAFG